MSLFSSKEWWSVNLNEDDLYDSQCLLVSIIGKDRYQSIFLGSHEGLLRVYGPTSGMTDDGEVIGYRPSDLVLETQLQAPILQMGVGTLVSGCSERNLAVLHPKYLTVYTLNRKDTENAVGDQISLHVVYQHNFRHSAYSFVVGHFGEGRGRDFICVQSLDGLLSFYEQESFAFQVYLSEFLLPSPFVYIDRIDCFLFLNSSLVFDCYSYESLASSAQGENENSKKIAKYWSYNIGESILGVKTLTGDNCNIVILTERNLYNVNENGKTVFMKRLEFVPMAFYAFLTAETKKLIILIATDNYLLNIYEDTCLKWSMKVDQIPVCVDRIILSNLYGGIVLLSQTGYLQCIYLGTHPSVYLLPPAAKSEVNVVEAEEELKKLQIEISEKDISDPAEIDVVGVDLTVDQQIVQEESKRICKIAVEVHCQAPVNKLQVIFSVHPPLSVAEKSHLISCCDRIVVESQVSAEKPGTVTDLCVRACVSYINSNGVPFVLERRGNLPLSLVLEKTNPAKEAHHKITVVTNKPVCPLNVIFREFTGGDDNPNVIGLKCTNSDAVVTVLTAKTTQRYRLQSDNLECIGLVLRALIERLKRHSADYDVSYGGGLPLQVYFDEIERYFNVLAERRCARDRLSKRTCQYRTIQKKVLLNLKDLTPKPISNLNSILSDTYEMILFSVEEIEAIEREVKRCRFTVSALSSLLFVLMELMPIGVRDLNYLKIVLDENVYDSDDQGWLEVQLAAAMYFLRTTLAKSMRDQQKPSEISLEPITSAAKLIRGLSSVVDRVTKGTHILERTEYENEKEHLSTVPGLKETCELEEKDIPLIPEGSKLANLSSAASPESCSGSSRKEKRLIKQERVDSLGAISEPVNVEDNLLEASLNTAGTERQNINSDASKFVPIDERASSFDSPDDDAIWDVRVDEMRI